MIDKLSIGDVAVKIAEYRDFRITHDDLVEWSRAAMMATDIYPLEVNMIMDLLQDISASTPVSMRRAIEEHSILMSRVKKDGDQLYFSK